MTNPELNRAIQEALPELIASDPAIRDFVLRTVSNYYADKAETESRFDRILADMQRDREEQNRKWEESNRKWEESNRKWEEQTRENQTMLAEIQAQNRKWEEQTRENQALRAEYQAENQRFHERWEEQTRENQALRAEYQAENQRFHERWEEQTRENQAMLADIQAQNRKWEEQTRENQAMLADIQAQNRKWEEQTRENQAMLADIQAQNRKWEEQTRENQTMLAKIQDQKRQYDSTIGALGARWGLYSEASFRNALRGILEDSFGVQVLNINDFDESGEVFGRPEQIELDLIIRNGEVIVCEIKSSVSKSEMYIFNRKVEFYQKRHERPVTRKMVISPMIDDRARPVAEALGIEVYSYADSVQNL